MVTVIVTLVAMVGVFMRMSTGMLMLSPSSTTVMALLHFALEVMFHVTFTLIRWAVAFTARVVITNTFGVFG